MKKFIKTFDKLLFAFSLLFFALLYTGNSFLPDNITFYEGQETVRLLKVFTASNNLNLKNNTADKAEISLFGIIPVTTVSATSTDRRYVYAGGELVGIRLYTEGLLVVGTEKVDSSDGMISPAENCGIRKGDIITQVNGRNVESVAQFSIIAASCGDKKMTITVNRNNKSLKVELTPVFSVSEKKYRCGMWLRDSTAGIGTMTFSDPENKVIASLGHSICDSETGAVLPVGDGDLLDAVLNGCVSGTKGTTGQIKGSFGTKILGELAENNEYGVYATYSKAEFEDEKLYPVAAQTEIKTGKAQIITTVTSDGPEFYDIEIEKITYTEEKAIRSMVIRITDEELISVTGGIIQGMSGSPIIQNDMLVGAVTHVFLNDPTRGYGIFAETMIDTADSLTLKQAS